MGRAPCCDKANVKKGPWSPAEDAKLKAYIEEHGTGGNWIALPQKIGLKRCGKSCRLRWLNYLRPNIKHGGFSEEEDSIICSLYISIGSRWSIIAAQLPGRTDNDIKNYWNTRLKKKLLGKQRKEQQARRSSQKQEMTKKGRVKDQNPMVISDYNNIINQNPYWPELPHELPPIPYSSHQEPQFNNDLTSIRKLLIKLGGKFSDDHDQTTNQAISNLQFSTNVSSSVHPSYNEHAINIMSTANVLNAGVSSLPNNMQYNIDDQEKVMNTFPPELIEEMLHNGPLKLDGLEFLYGDMRIGTSGTNFGESVDWGEMSTLVYPSVNVSNEGTIQQGTLQECAFEELRYPGPGASQ